jgi:hypothetical protein
MANRGNWLPPSYRPQIFKTFSSRMGPFRAAFFISPRLPKLVAIGGFWVCELRCAASDPRSGKHDDDKRFSPGPAPP